MTGSRPARSYSTRPFQYAIVRASDVQNPAWWSQLSTQAAKDGTLPGYGYVIRKKGQLEVGNLSCASCHSRLMPDGSVLKGAQGNFPFDHTTAFQFRALASQPPPGMTPAQVDPLLHLAEYSLFAAPWPKPD